MLKLAQLLVKHEGLKLKPYKDTKGILTIGVGRNLESVGLSQEEALMLLSNDINRVKSELEPLEWFRTLDFVRQDVMLNMAFNMGTSKLLRFKKMIEAIKLRQWKTASEEMLASQWAEQVGSRAQQLAWMMSSGQYPVNLI